MHRLLLLFACMLLNLPAHAALRIAAWTLDNGARVLFVESHAVPIVDVNIDFDAGSRRDPPGKAGLAAMTNQLLATGVRAGDMPAMNEAQIADAFADIGAERSDDTSQDRAGIGLRTLAGTAERTAAVALLARMLAQPAFPQEAFAREQARAIAGLREELSKPEVLAGRALQQAMYGSHPYGQVETPQSLAAMTREDVQAFHAGHYVAGRAIVSLIGDMTRAQADAIAHALTDGLATGTALPAVPPVMPTAALEQRIAHPASQAHLLLGEAALARKDADYFPLIVGNYVLGGGGFVSRLMREIREKRGLVYNVDSHFQPLAQPVPFVISLETQKEQASAALQLVRATLASFLRDGPAPSELQAAKANLIGGFALRIDNNRKILANLSAIGFYNLPLDYLDTWTAKVAAVTLADIRSAFRRKVAAERMATVIVGPAVAASP